MASGREFINLRTSGFARMIANRTGRTSTVRCLGDKCAITCGKRPETGHIDAQRSINPNEMLLAVILLLLNDMKAAAASKRFPVVLLTAISTALLVAQPPPPKPDAPNVERRIEDIRSRLERNSVTTPQQKELAAFVERYLEDAARALNSGKRSQARQLADAADACRRPVDHLQRIASGQAPPRPARPGHPPPRADDPQDHLRQIYFRLRLCDFFLQQIPPPAPSRLLELAREFYDQAVQAEQANNSTRSDEYAMASDDLTHALESLAQAALP